MVPAKQGTYVFDPASIRKLRESLGWSQAQLATELAVPVNTVSRWESGATAPDAHSLAAIHSVSASKLQKVPEFFRKGTPSQPVVSKRTRLVVLWDLQNRNVSRGKFEHNWRSLNTFMRAKYPGITPAHLVAFTDWQHEMSNKAEIRDAGFESESIPYGDTDSKMLTAIESLGGRKAQRTVLILVTRDGDFADAIDSVKRKGCDVWIWGGGQESKHLVNTVGRKHVVPIEFSA